MNINILKEFKLIFFYKNLINIIFNQLHLQNNFNICIFIYFKIFKILLLKHVLLHFK